MKILYNVVRNEYNIKSCQLTRYYIQFSMMSPCLTPHSDGKQHFCATLVSTAVRRLIQACSAVKAATIKNRRELFRTGSFFIQQEAILPWFGSFFMRTLAPTLMLQFGGLQTVVLSLRLKWDSWYWRSLVGAILITLFITNLYRSPSQLIDSICLSYNLILA